MFEAAPVAALRVLFDAEGIAVTTEQLATVALAMPYVASIKLLLTAYRETIAPPLPAPSRQ